MAKRGRPTKSKLEKALTEKENEKVYGNKKLKLHKWSMEEWLKFSGVIIEFSNSVGGITEALSGKVSENLTKAWVYIEPVLADMIKDNFDNDKDKALEYLKSHDLGIDGLNIVLDIAEMNFSGENKKKAMQLLNRIGLSMILKT